MPIDLGYTFTPAQYPELVARRFFPEKTGPESAIYRDYLSRHIYDFDRIHLQVRVGEGLTPDPAFLDGVQRQAIRNSKKVIDVLGWKGLQPTIVEIKIRVLIQAIGQIRGYRQLFLEANPDALDPRLVIAGRYSDPDTIRVIATEGIDLYLYPEDTANVGP
jgi:hypothetical protein